MASIKALPGTRVVRSKGDYVVGRVGEVIEIDEEKGRVNVQWDNHPKSWVKIDCVELERTPYKMTPESRNPRTGRWTNAKYIKL